MKNQKWKIKLPACFCLATYLQQDAPSVNIFNLLLEHILDHAENDLNRRPFGEEWRGIKEAVDTLNKRSPKQKQELIDRIKNFNFSSLE